MTPVTQRKDIRLHKRKRDVLRLKEGGEKMAGATKRERKRNRGEKEKVCGTDQMSLIIIHTNCHYKGSSAHLPENFLWLNSFGALNGFKIYSTVCWPF